MPIERIYIPEAKIHLAIKSNEAVVKWCEENNVKIYSERNRRFMCRIEFLAALEKPFIRSLKRKYGAKWKEAYQVMETNDPSELVDFCSDSSESEAKPFPRLRQYRPRSEASKSFLKSIEQAKD